MSVQRRPDGRWRARWRGPDGVERAKHFDTRREGMAWEAAERARAQRGEWLDATSRAVTFGDFAETWAASQPWRPTTTTRAASTLRHHLLPAFGARPLASVRPSEVQTFAKALSDGRSPGTVNGVLRIMKAIYRAAQADRLVSSNPVDGVKVATYDPRVTIPTRAQVDALLDAAPERWRPLVIVAAGAGLRQGEALGLTADRVRWLAKEIVVDRQLVDVPNDRVLFGPPKSARSERVVPASGFVVEALAAHVERFGTGPAGLLFVDELGRPVGSRDFSRRWAAIQRSAGVTCRYHDLRHFCASTMLSAGVPAPVVAEALGHSVAQLLGTYAHVVGDDRDRARQAIEAAFALPTSASRTRQA
jgi:integrase